MKMPKAMPAKPAQNCASVGAVSNTYKEPPLMIIATIPETMSHTMLHSHTTKPFLNAVPQDTIFITKENGSHSIMFISFMTATHRFNMGILTLFSSAIFLALA